MACFLSKRGRPWYNMVMFMVDLVSWWYFRGWSIFLSGLKKKLGDTFDTFSIGEMFRTLFKPYRQISAVTDGTAISSAIDKLISRFVGMFARLILIIAGIIALILEAIIGLAITVIWPVVPILPVAGILLAVFGVTF